MANKRLFPGVSEEDILENERYEQLMQQSEQEEEKQKQLEDQARKLYLKFGKKLSTIATESKRFVVKQAMMLTGLYALYGIGLAFTKHEHNNLFTKTVSITDLAKANDVYQRTKSKGAKTWALLTNPVKETYSFSNLFDLHADYSAQTLTKPSVTHLSDLRAIRAYLGLASIIPLPSTAWELRQSLRRKTSTRSPEGSGQCVRSCAKASWPLFPMSWSTAATTVRAAFREPWMSRSRTSRESPFS